MGFSSLESVSLLLIVNALGGPARPVVGHIADKYLGPINTFILSMSTLSIIVFGWIGVHSRTGMYIFCVFFGMANGATQGMFVGALASLTKDPQKMGVRFGMVATICAFAALAGPPTGGAIIDRSEGKFVWGQVWEGTVLIAGVLMLIASRTAAVGWRLWVKI